MISNKYADPIYDPRNNVPEFARTRIAELEAENKRLRAVMDAAKEVINAPNKHDRRVELGWLEDALAETDDGHD